MLMAHMPMRVVSSRLRSSGAVVGVTEFGGVLTDTSFDPACPVDEYDTTSTAVGCQSRSGSCTRCLT